MKNFLSSHHQNKNVNTPQNYTFRIEQNAGFHHKGNTD